MREVGPGVARGAVVLPDRAPLPFTEVRPPAPPGHAVPVRLVEPLPFRVDVWIHRLVPHAHSGRGSSGHLDGPGGPRTAPRGAPGYESALAFRFSNSESEIFPSSRSCASFAISSAAEYPEIRRSRSFASAIMRRSWSVIFGRAIM